MLGADFADESQAPVEPSMAGQKRKITHSLTEQAHRRWSFSTNPSANSSSNNSNNAPPQMGSEEFARAVYSQALNDIHRQQSLALNQLHQVCLPHHDRSFNLLSAPVKVGMLPVVCRTNRTYTKFTTAHTASSIIIHSWKLCTNSPLNHPHGPSGLLLASSHTDPQKLMRAHE